MLTAQARAIHEATSGARKRVDAAGLGAPIGDAQALQLALTGTTREPHELAAFVFPSAIVRRKPPYGRLKLTIVEFRTLYGADAAVVHEGGVEAAVGADDFHAFGKRIESALRCTLLEAVPGAAWQRPRGRAAALLAMHMDDPVAALGAVLGGVVHTADNRRVEDLAAHMDDTEPQTMLLGNVVVALAASVVL